MTATRIIDNALRRGLTALCAALLALMTGFTLYTVVMRTAFSAPPFWGDTLTLFANIWLVLLAFPLAVRERSNIAMEALHPLLPRAARRGLRMLWTLLFAALGVLMTVKGYEAAARIPGAYWELGNLPKSYPMAVLPVVGVLTTGAALLAFADQLRGIPRPPATGDPSSEEAAEAADDDTGGNR